MVKYTMAQIVDVVPGRASAKFRRQYPPLGYHRSSISNFGSTTMSIWAKTSTSEVYFRRSESSSLVCLKSLRLILLLMIFDIAIEVIASKTRYAVQHAIQELKIMTKHAWISRKSNASKGVPDRFYSDTPHRPPEHLFTGRQHPHPPSRGISHVEVSKIASCLATRVANAWKPQGGRHLR